MSIGMLGAIAEGIGRGRRNVDERRRLEEDRKFLAQQREFMGQHMARETARQEGIDKLNTGMAKAMQGAEDTATADTTAGGRSFAVKAPDGTSLMFDDKAKAEGYLADVDSRAAALSPMQQGIRGATQQPGAAQTFALPQKQGLRIKALDGEQARPENAMIQATSEEEQPVAAYTAPTRADGSLDIEEIIRPKRNKDALFYYGPWRSQFRARYVKEHGIAAAKAADDFFKAGAEEGYKQRLLEAAELQKAGDAQGLALKLNEIYNRDYVDGNFSNIRFLKDGQMEVVRFTPEGRIVDRHVQKVPDMIGMAMSILSPEERLKMLAGTGGKAADWTDVTVDGQAGAANVLSGEIKTFGKPGQNIQHASNMGTLIAAMASSGRQNDQQAFQAGENEKSRAQQGQLTDKQKIELKQNDAAINNARNLWNNTVSPKRKAAGVDPVPRSKHDPDYETYNKAREKTSRELGIQGVY